MYLLSIVSVVVVTVFLCLMSLGAGGQYEMWRLIDFPTVVMIALFLIPLLLSGGLFKDFNNAFRIVVGKKKAESLMELKRANEAVGLTRKALVAVSVFVSAMQSIQILYTLDDISNLGPKMAIAILSVLYAMGISMILLPLQSILNIKIQEFISQEE